MAIRYGVRLPRDAQGRFVSEAEATATRLLEAALTEVRDRIAGRGWVTLTIDGHTVHTWRRWDHDALTQVLAEAARTADLLLMRGAA